MQKTLSSSCELDRLINQYTAFRSFQDLKASTDTGYVPTIYRARKGDEQRLVRMLRARGVKVWTGR